jgi:predicted porin
MQNARNRTSDSIGYASPKMGDFIFRARTYLRGTAAAEDSAKGSDFGLDYQSGVIKAAVGYSKDSRVGGFSNNDFKEKWQLGVNYKIDKDWDVYAIGGIDTYKNTSTTRSDVNYTQVGSSCTVGKHKIVLNTFQRDVQASLTGVRKKNQLSYQYFLSKQTDLQAFIDKDSVDSSKTNVQVRAIGLGIRQNF